MKKVYFLFAAAFFLLAICNTALADISLEEKAISNIVIKELSSPATFEITIKNDNSYPDSFIIDTLHDINISPNEPVEVGARSEKTVVREIYPSEEMRKDQNGTVSFEYYAKGSKSEIKRSNMVLKFVSLPEIISIDVPASITKDDSEISAKVSLSENIELETEMTLVSEILSYTNSFSLTNDGAEFIVPLKEELPAAGVYEVKATFSISGYDFIKTKDIVLEPVITVKEETAKTGNFLDYTVESSKENTGNAVTDVLIEIRKSTIASLFTKCSISPDNVKSEGGVVIYEFTKKLNPGEKLAVEAKTSYYLPLAILILIVIAAWIFIVVTTPQIKVTKKAVKVKTKSGIFATKIVLAIANKGKEVNNIKSIDHLPAFTELVPEKFGTLSPSEIKKSRLVWTVDSLGRNEEIMLSYIVYSKVGVIGKLEIPLTFATYMDSKGKLHEAKSNSLFVLAQDESDVLATEVQ